MVRELDMGFTVEEVVSGIEQLLQRLGSDRRLERFGDRYRLAGPRGVTIEVSPMPEHRITHPVLFPRTLLVLRGEEEPLRELERSILHAFLRVGG